MKELDLNNKILVEHLLYYDGPILSHYKIDNDSYLFLLAEENKTYERYLIFYISSNTLEEYFDKKISLYDCIMKNKYVYFGDYEYNNDSFEKFILTNITKFNSIDVDDKYLPEKDLFHF